MTEAALAIDGRLLAGWTSVSVTVSLEQLSPTLSLVMSERSPGEASPRVVRPGQSAAMTLDGETVLTGHVDAVIPSYDALSHVIEVRGRDATGDLVDCSSASQPGEWKDADLSEIATALCAPFGIGVRVGVMASVGDVFRRFRIEEGETVFETIERGCRLRSLVPIADGAGGLVLARPVRDRASVRLERGVNILSAQGRIDWTGRYSAYTVLGQQPGDDFLTPGGAAHVRAVASDTGVRRHRPLTIVAEQGLTETEAKERAIWEADIRAARARRASITVQGWRERGDSGPLWRPGRLVTVVDDWLGLDRALLISTATYTKTSGGSTTVLSLLPEEAFSAMEPARAMPQDPAAVFFGAGVGAETSPRGLLPGETDVTEWWD